MVEVIYIKQQFETGPAAATTVGFTEPEIFADFKKFLRDAKPGEKFKYYSGTHITGTRIGKIAFRAYEDGKVELFQTKEADKFNYWAQKKKRNPEY
jgi:hypothetical protein